LGIQISASAESCLKVLTFHPLTNSTRKSRLKVHCPWKDTLNHQYKQLQSESNQQMSSHMI